MVVVRGATVGAVAFIWSVCGVSIGAQATTVTSGDIQVTMGNVPNEPKIYFDAIDNNSSTEGHVGSQAGTLVFDFTADTAVDYANGFATVKALNGEFFHTLTVTAPTGYLFRDLVFSSLKANQLTITGMNELDVIGTYSSDEIGNGDTEWLTLAINGKAFTSIVLYSFDGFDQAKQFQVSGLQECVAAGCAGNINPPAVPVPAALWLFGTAVAGAASIGKLRRKRTRSLGLAAAGTSNWTHPILGSRPTLRHCSVQVLLDAAVCVNSLCGDSTTGGTAEDLRVLAAAGGYGMRPRPRSAP